jgi:uncharacterized protein (DUF3084 family)
MYEPYGEGKKFRIDWERLKEKIRTFKFNKTVAIIVAIIAIGALSGVTGYVSYTSKVTELTSKLLIKEKQMAAVENNLTSCLSDLESEKNATTQLQAESTKCKIDLQNTKTELEECGTEKKNLSVKLAELEGTVGEWKTKYEELEDKYEILENQRNAMEKNYAKGCCNFGFSYYFVKDNTKVICCSRRDVNSCGEVPENLDAIKEIAC